MRKRKAASSSSSGSTSTTIYSSSYAPQQQHLRLVTNDLNDVTMHHTMGIADPSSSHHHHHLNHHHAEHLNLESSPNNNNTRQVEYLCAMCNEPYPSSSDLNPWWALSNQDCPKCSKVQIPRLDITAPINAMEYHPALLAHLDEMGGGGKISSGITSIAESMSYYPPPMPTASTYHVPSQPIYQTAPVATAVRRYDSDSDVSHTDESDGEGGSSNVASGLNYDESSDEEDIMRGPDGKEKRTYAELKADENGDIDSIAREECIDREEYGHDYKGETLSDDQAQRLLVLIEHASTCPGKHQSTKHRNACHSTKYLMLHVRDCSGLLPNGDLCPFPWCRKVKHLLYHLVSCEEGKECTICCPPEDKLSSNLQTLVGLNTHRRNKFKERVKVVLAKRQQQLAAARAANKLVGTTTNVAARPVQQLKIPAQPTNKLTAVSNQVSNPAPQSSVSVKPASTTVVQPQTLQTQNPASAAQPATTAIAAPATTAAQQQQQMPSPALSASLSGLPSSLSVSGLPTLEEAAMDLGMSASDLMDHGAVKMETT